MNYILTEMNTTHISKQSRDVEINSSAKGTRKI